MEDKKKTYDDLIAFYDYAEKLIDAVEMNQTKNPEEQVRILEPLIEQIEESTETLVEIYMRFVETGKQPPSYERQRAEKAIRRLFLMIERCRQQAQKVLQ
jgi:hypothetical protein